MPLKKLPTESEINEAKGGTLEGMRAIFESHGIAPAGWRDMRAYEKRAWMVQNLPAKKQSKGLKALGAAVLGAILPGMSVVVESTAPSPVNPVAAPKSSRQFKSATMPRDPNWKRREQPGWVIPFSSARRAAKDPVPLTRQVRRQNERRADKLRFRDQNAAKLNRFLHHMMRSKMDMVEV